MDETVEQYECSRLGKKAGTKVIARRRMRGTPVKDSFYLQVQITYCLDHKQMLDSFSLTKFSNRTIRMTLLLYT